MARGGRASWYQELDVDEVEHEKCDGHDLYGGFGVQGSGCRVQGLEFRV